MGVEEGEFERKSNEEVELSVKEKGRKYGYLRLMVFDI